MKVRNCSSHVYNEITHSTACNTTKPLGNLIYQFHFRHLDVMKSRSLKHLTMRTFLNITLRMNPK